MKLRVFATLLMAITTLTASLSPAQQMQWGYGMYGGMQPCQGFGSAGGASDEDDETAELKQERADLRREKKEIEKNYRQLERDLEKYREQIAEVVKPKLGHCYHSAHGQQNELPSLRFRRTSAGRCSSSASSRNSCSSS